MMILLTLKLLKRTTPGPLLLFPMPLVYYWGKANKRCQVYLKKLNSVSKPFSYLSVLKLGSFYGDFKIHEERVISDQCKHFNIVLVRSISKSCPLRPSRPDNEFSVDTTQWLDTEEFCIIHQRRLKRFFWGIK